MELHGADIFAFDDRGEIDSVGADRRGELRGRVERVREIDERLIGKAFEQARRCNAPELVPAHVRYALIGGEAADSTRKNPKAARLRRFFAGFEQRLQTEANSK